MQQLQQGVDLRLRRRSGAAGDARLYAVHSLDHAAAVEGLQQVIDRVHIEGADGVLVIGGGEDNLRQRRGFGCGVGGRMIALAKALDDGESVQAGHLHIEEDEVGMVLLDQVHGLDTVAALGYDVHAAHRLEKILELVAGQLFIVDDERGQGHVELNCRDRSLGLSSRRADSVADHAQAGRHLVGSQLMSAAGAELVSSAHGAEAVAAACG